MRVWRSKEEITKIVEQFQTSGLTRADFCRRSGIPLGTMNNYWRRHVGKGFVRVQLEQPETHAPIAVVVGKGRRIEVTGSAFSEAMLIRLIRAVEAA